MIIGNGDIASVLNDRDGAIFFASGVSNSQSVDRNEFDREWLLLCNVFDNYHQKEPCLFYFSSIAVNLIDTSYTKHKLKMEKAIKTSFSHYNIIRLGNIDWGKNPNTFINYIRAKQNRGEQVEIRDEWRYMISKQQLLLLTDNLPLRGRHEISVFGEMKKVRDCL